MAFALSAAATLGVLTEAQSAASKSPGRTGKGQAMNEAQTDTTVDAVTRGQTALSPAAGSANSLVLTLAPGLLASSPALMLHGAFNLGVDLVGRHGGDMPGPIQVVAISRETGQVFMQHLTRDDDLPPTYRGDSAPPSVVRRGPGGPTTAGISEIGFFRVDLKRQLALPDRAGAYDVFLWIDSVLSEMASAAKRPEPGDRPGALRDDRPATIAKLRLAAASDRLELRTATEGEARHVLGYAGSPRVSVIAHAVQSGVSGWTVLEAEVGSGIEFDIDVRQLLPGVAPTDRILVLAVAAGRRSALLSVPPLPSAAPK